MTAWTRPAVEQLISVLAAQASRRRQWELLETIQTTIATLPRQFPASSPVKGVAVAPVPETSSVILYRLSSQHGVTILGFFDPVQADT